MPPGPADPANRGASQFGTVPAPLVTDGVRAGRRASAVLYANGTPLRRVRSVPIWPDPAASSVDSPRARASLRGVCDSPSLTCEHRVNVTLREITANDPSLEADLYPLLAALRPGLSVNTFDTLLSEGREQGLRVLVADQGAERCIGAALYRIVATSRGRVTFLDDLVTNPARRSKGVGAALLAEVERRGCAAGCERLELDSGVNNQGSHRFYHRHGLHILALHFAKELESA